MAPSSDSREPVGGVGGFLGERHNRLVGRDRRRGALPKLMGFPESSGLGVAVGGAADGDRLFGEGSRGACRRKLLAIWMVCDASASAVIPEKFDGERGGRTMAEGDRAEVLGGDTGARKAGVGDVSAAGRGSGVHRAPPGASNGADVVDLIHVRLGVADMDVAEGEREAGLIGAAHAAGDGLGVIAARR